MYKYVVTALFLMAISAPAAATDCGATFPECGGDCPDNPKGEVRLCYLHQDPRGVEFSRCGCAG